MPAEFDAQVDKMFLVGKPAWHGMGTQIPMECDSELAIKMSGLDWDVEVVPIITKDHLSTDIDDYMVTRRVTDQAILGLVKKKFKPIQNRDAFRFFDSIVGKGAAVYHTAGSLRGGSRVWILAKLPDPIEVGKGIGSIDLVDRYLLLANSHDGRLPLHMLFTPVRVVCNNTLNAALFEQNKDKKWNKNSPIIKIRHDNRAEFAMREAERTMGVALAYYKKFGDFADYMYRKQFNGEQVSNIINEVFPPNKKKVVTPTISYNRATVATLFTDGIGHDKIAGSAWALFNAFTQFADHDVACRNIKAIDDKARSTWYGSSKGLKMRASKIITQACAA